MEDLCEIDRYIGKGWVGSVLIEAYGHFLTQNSLALALSVDDQFTSVGIVFNLNVICGTKSPEN